MFKNIGKKIKGLAKFICWLGIILSVLIGVIMITGGSVDMSGIEGAENLQGLQSMGWVGGVLFIIIGCLASWIGSFFTYGFGQLIENTDKIANRQ